MKDWDKVSDSDAARVSLRCEDLDEAQAFLKEHDINYDEYCQQRIKAAATRKMTNVALSALSGLLIILAISSMGLHSRQDIWSILLGIICMVAVTGPVIGLSMWGEYRIISGKALYRNEVLNIVNRLIIPEVTLGLPEKQEQQFRLRTIRTAAFDGLLILFLIIRFLCMSA